ncbi:M28 family peptidase [Sphingomonas sp.]
MNALLAAGLAGLALLTAPAAAQGLSREQAEMKAHVAFLAADSLKGRQPGTPEYEIAVDYVAAQMAAAGLEPAGANGTWRQPVPLVAARPVSATATLTRGNATTALEAGRDFVGRASLTREEREVSGEVVFAGYGVVDPTRGIDDYRGLDVRGRIVAVLYGTQPGLHPEVSAHYGNRDVKAELAGRMGAAGIVFIEARATRRSFDFAAIAEAWSGVETSWTSLDPARPRSEVGAPQLAALSEAGAAKLFAGSRLPWQRVRAADNSQRAVPTGALAVTATFRQTSELATMVSNNVVGKLAGSDPALAGEYVVLTAHLDHLGVGEAVKGDAIHNGAMDNAMGVAAMLEVAKGFRGDDAKPRRSLLFVALTAEEAGLIGSDYFARNPTVPRDSIVANVNLDMPILTYAFQDIVAFGADRSSIGLALADVAQAEDVGVVPDPSPEEASFVRSDHYSFVRQGVPAVSIDTGPGGPGARATAEFLDRHYHQPSDDMKLPFDWQAARRFVSLNRRLVAALANGPRPTWNDGDFFGAMYGGR